MECGGVPILAIKPFTPQDVICVDESTLSALQIFNTRWQTSGSRAGSWNQSREGNSIFSLLNRCKSVHGSRQLKYLLRCLPTQIEVIQSRQEAVAYFSQPDKIGKYATFPDFFMIFDTDFFKFFRIFFHFFQIIPDFFQFFWRFFILIFDFSRFFHEFFNFS